MPACDLCDLETPDPPVTDAAVPGTFCCRGCLEVARQLDDLESVDGSMTPETVRNRLSEGANDADPDLDPESVEETYLAVEGMHCATCEAFLEATATDEAGVVDAEASYAAELLKVRYDPSRIDRAGLPGLVEGLGYRARDPDEDRERGRPYRLYVGAFFAMATMMWYVMLYVRYLGLGDGDGTGGLVGLALACTAVGATVVLGYTGAPILRGAYVSLQTRRPNMDLLIALAATNAYVYSVLTLLSGGTEVYFDIVVTVIMVVTVGNHYEARIKRRVAGLLSDLAEDRIEEARRRTPDGTETVPVEEVAAGDRLLVRPGERVPLDGRVVEGRAAVDESLVTGESVPVEKSPGDPAVGGSVVTDDALVVEVGEDATSTYDRLVDYLWGIQSSRAGVQRLVDRVAAVFVPLVLLVAAAAFGWHLLSGTSPVASLLVALSVLVVSCPCALGLATPLAVASGLRSALDRGILVTDATVFERATDVDVVAFDKTGTLTTGDMRVVDRGDRRGRRLAAAVESYASHPIATAIVEAADAPDVATRDFRKHPGKGVSARVTGADLDGERVYVGRPSLFDERDWSIPGTIADRADRARERGNVPVLVGWDGRVRSALVVGDAPREGWTGVVEDLGEDRRVVVITGDAERAASEFRDHPAVDEVFADVPPEAKAEVVERLRSEGTVAMVGDGSNDAPALAAADLGVALQSGAALAEDAADVVVSTDDLSAVPATFDLARAARRRIRENLAWAFVYNAIAVPVAAVGLINPLFAALAMAASSLLVVGNSSRSLVPDGDGPPSTGGSPSPPEETPARAVGGD